MTGWIFLYICTAFACHGTPPIEGNAEYYTTRAACMRDATTFAAISAIKTPPWEIVCVERERPR